MNYVIEILKKENNRILKLDENEIIEDFSRIKTELGLLGVYSVVYYEYLHHKTGITTREFRRETNKSLKLLLNAGITKNEVRKSVKRDFLSISGRTENQLDIDTKLQLDNLIYSFIECGTDFMHRISNLQPYNPRDLIDMAEFIMGSFETIDRFIIDPRVKKIKKIIEEQNKLKK